MPFRRFVPLIRLCCKRLWSQDCCQKPWTFVHCFHLEQVPNFNSKNITTIDPYSVRFVFIIFNYFANVEFWVVHSYNKCCCSCKKLVNFLSQNVVSTSQVVWSGCTENASIDLCPQFNIHCINMNFNTFNQNA